MRNHTRNWQWLRRALTNTRWSLVRRLRRDGKCDVLPHDAFDDFCRAYWFPLFAFLRHKGYSVEEAQDHVQSFFADFSAKGDLGKADPSRGKLRNYLMTLIERHAAARHARSTAIKRGGGAVHLSFDWHSAEAEYQSTGRTASSPEDACRRALAAHLVQRGIAGLRAYYEETGKKELCEALLPALEGPLENATYEQAAARLGMKPGALRMASVRLRERFKQIIREEAATLLAMPDGPQLDQEILHLLSGEIRPATV